MAPTTRAQAALALVLKKHMSQAVRAKWMVSPLRPLNIFLKFLKKNHFKTVNIDGPFHGTRSGLNAPAIPPLPIGEAQQPGVTDVPQENMQDLVSCTFKHFILYFLNNYADYRWSTAACSRWCTSGKHANFSKFYIYVFHTRLAK